MPLKILYGINSNGQGHINRARTIIHQLQQDGHQINTVFSGPQPPAYAFELGDSYKCVSGWELVYENRRVDILATFLRNIKTAIKLPIRMRDFIREFNEHSYDLIITDFDLISSLTGKLTNTPTISIDHQHSLLHPSAKLPQSQSIEKYATMYSVSVTTPFKDYYFAIDYTMEKQPGENGMLYPLIWKNELSDYKVTEEGHILVYLSTYRRSDLKKFFGKFSDQEFIIYGYNTEERIGNIHFKKTSREEFLQDLTSAKGIIAHSGFSLTWETSILGKKLWAIPQLRQFEQIVNAFRIEQNNLGITSSTLDLQTYKKFQSYLIEGEPNKLPTISTKKFTKDLYRKINIFLNQPFSY